MNYSIIACVNLRILEGKVLKDEEPKKLFNKNYLLLWQGQFISRLGTQFFAFAMIVWITEVYDSPSLNSLFMMLGGIPAVIFSIIGGAVADRYRRKRIIVFTDLINGAVVLVLALLFMFAPERQNFILIGIFAANMTAATMGAFFGPAIMASIPELVPKKFVPTANSLGQMSRQTSMFVGQGLGSFAYLLLGAPLLTLVNGISYLFSAFSESFIRIPQELPERIKSFKPILKSFKADISEGIKYIRQTSGLKELVFASVFITFFSAPITVLLIFFVLDFLEVGIVWLSILLVAHGAGNLVGSLIVGITRVHGEARKFWMILFMLLESTGYIILALIRMPVLAAIIMFFGGIMMGFFMVNISSILQYTVPSKIRGRVFGVLTTISGSIAPIGMGISGPLAELLNNNIPLVYIISGVFMILFTIWIALKKSFRDFLAYETDEEKGPTGFKYNIRMINEQENNQMYLNETIKQMEEKYES
ncbi:MAG: MFS transporter [Caldithrix sp.]|nr:MFS transporter [Caldithrix sp.]